MSVQFYMTDLIVFWISFDATNKVTSRVKKKDTGKRLRILPELVFENIPRFHWWPVKSL